MALFARFFSQRKSVKKENVANQSLINKNSQRRPFDLKIDQVRVLLFRECDWRGRKLLFDSGTKPKAASDSKGNASNDIRQNNGDQADVNAVGEAVFGAVAMLLAGPAVKVHTLSEPRRLMLSSVFRCPHVRTRTRQVSDRSVDSSYGSSINSASDILIDTSNGDLKSSSCTKPSSVANSVEKQESFDDFECFSNCPLHNLSIPHYGSTPTVSSGRSSSGGSLSSLRRRWLRSTATAVSRLDVPGADCGPRSRGSTRLAVALIVTSDSQQPTEMEQFLLERIPLLVQMITTIQYKAEKAYMHKDAFHQIMTDASSDAAQAIHDLFCCMRIETPLWISITSKSQTNTELQLDLLTKFIRDLGFLLQTLDTKNSNFFMSTLLTAVLTHHLGWVSTVSDENETNGDHCCSKKGQLSALSESHPYSALWAQLDDLKGALGTPSKVARTIIIGRSQSLVTQVLSVLSYFVRCGRVQSRKESKIDNQDEKMLLDPVAPEMKTENTSKKTELLPENGNCRRRNGYVTRIDRQNTFRTVKSGSNLVKQGTYFDSVLISDKVTEINLEKQDTDFDSVLISDKVTKLCRIPKSAIEYHDNDLVEKRLSHSQLITPRGECEKQGSCVEIKNSINRRTVECDLTVVVESPKTNGVVFMVGDDDRLTDLSRLGNSNMEETDRTTDEVDFISSDFTNSCSSDTDERDGSDTKSKPSEHLESSHSFPDVLRAKQQLDNCPRRSSDNSGVCREVRPMPVDRGKDNETGESVKMKNCSDDCRETDKPTEDCSRIYLAIPESWRDEEETEVVVAGSVVGGVSDHYMPCMVVQGVVEREGAGSGSRSWMAELRRDLGMEVRSPLLNQQHDESVCIVADLDNCEVRVMSSRLPAFGDGGCWSGMPAVMSRLVADMLEAVLHLCKLSLPPQMCAEHIELKLDEFVTRSRTLSELLLSSADLLRIETLSTALDLDQSDVTLLMAIASVHTPQLATRYGITLH